MKELVAEFLLDAAVEIIPRRRTTKGKAPVSVYAASVRVPGWMTTAAGSAMNAWLADFAALYVPDYPQVAPTTRPDVGSVSTVTRSRL
jgi:hypothetical protein